MLVIENFLDTTEENSIFKEIDPYLQRLRYEFDHWDDVSIKIVYKSKNKNLFLCIGYTWVSRN